MVALSMVPPVWVRLVGIADQVLHFDLVVGEELAELVEDVRAIGGTDIDDVRQGLGRFSRAALRVTPTVKP